MVLAMVATTESPLEEPFPIYTGDEFKALYDHAVRHELPNLVPPSGRLPVTGDPDLDDRIWDIATARGYVLRPVAGPDLGSAVASRRRPVASTG